MTALPPTPLDLATTLADVDPLRHQASHLLADAAHDLRGPLSSLKGDIEQAAAEAGIALADQLHQGLVSAMDRCRELEHVISDMLEFERMQTGHPSLLRTVVNTQALRLAVESILFRGAAEKQIRLVWRGFEQAGPRVWGDPEKLQRYLVNLGLNAIQAMPDGGRITFYLIEGDAGSVKLGVRDTGKGFLDHESAELVSRGRLGIDGRGLTICRHIAALHHSHLEFHSEAGVGSCFEIQLPVASPSAVANALVRWRNHPTPTPADDSHRLPVDLPLPRYSDVLLHGVSLVVPDDVSLEEHLLHQLDQSIQEDIRIHECVYRVAATGWILCWDENSDSFSERRQKIAASVRGILAQSGIGHCGSAWSPPRFWPTTITTQRSPLIEAFVRLVWDLADRAIETEEIAPEEEPFTIASMDGNPRLQNRLAQELRRITSHFRSRQTALQAPTEVLQR